MIGKPVRVLLMSLLATLFLVTPTFGETSYHMEIVAKTGEQFGDEGVFEDVGWGPSINDLGNVAFTGRVRVPEQGPDTAKEGVFVWNGETMEKLRRSSWVNSFYYNFVAQISHLDTAFDFGDVVQINNQDQVVWRVEAHDGLFGFILRLGSTPQDFKIVAKKYYPRIDNPDLTAESPFTALYPWVTIANRVGNNSRVVFSGVLRSPAGGTAISTPVDTEQGGHDYSGDFYQTNPVSGYPNFFPMITDDNYTLVRAGASVTYPLLLFSDETFSWFWEITPEEDFTSIGSRSGVSDDSVAIAFVGSHVTHGGGIFVELPSHAPFKIAGIPGDGDVDPNGAYVDQNDNGQLDPGEEDLGFFATFRLGSRIGVNRTTSDSNAKYTVAYVAQSIQGIDGLYTTCVDVSNPDSLRVTEPSLVVEIGDSIAGLPGTINQIELYDPVNNGGQIVLWISTNTCDQAILRATPGVTIESFDANRHFTTIDLPFEESSESLLEDLADFEPLVFGDEDDQQVTAVAADGVSLLLIRFKIRGELDGQVTFSLENSSDGPLGTIWRVDSYELISDGNGDYDLETPVGETSISVDVFLHDEETFAFALYRAPRNFDWDENSYSSASWQDRKRDIKIRARFISSEPCELREIEVNKTISVVRPPVLLVHGTWDKPSGWNSFPLWTESSNDSNNFDSPDPENFYPYTTYRLDYSVNNDGRLYTNARIVLQDMTRAIWHFRDTTAYREFGISRIAAAQADIVTHSYGGPITRMASQIQPDTDPLTVAGWTNFRNCYNWGYGYIHKLITMSGTHKGSQLPAHTARVNAMSHGLLKTLPIFFGKENRIHCGALADQHVVSPALQSLEDARFPCHAIVGSGLYQYSVPGNPDTGFRPLEKFPFDAFFAIARNVDVDSEYSQAGLLAPWLDEQGTARRLTNYVFNLAYEDGAKSTILDERPWPNGDGPNYDLTVRLSSMLGGLDEASDAVTDILEDPYFVGKLTHLQELRDTVPFVPIKINFLLHQPAASSYFDRFPAVDDDIIDAFDRRMMEDFPYIQLELDLSVGIQAPCFEEELFEILRLSDTGVSVIQDP